MSEYQENDVSPEPSDEINGLLAPPGQSEIADAIRAAIGAGPDEAVSVYAPPHASRDDGKTVRYFPLNLEEFNALRTMPRKRLVEIGLRPWDEETGLLLFPREWYPLIPAGFEVVSISGGREAFEPGKTDDDCRFGVLAYGIIPETSHARVSADASKEDDRG